MLQETLWWEADKSKEDHGTLIEESKVQMGLLKPEGSLDEEGQRRLVWLFWDIHRKGIGWVTMQATFEQEGRKVKCDLSAVGESLRSEDRSLAICNTKGRVSRSVTSAMFNMANQDQQWLANGKSLDRSCKSDVEESETIGEIRRWCTDDIRFQ